MNRTGILLVLVASLGLGCGSSRYLMTLPTYRAALGEPLSSRARLAAIAEPSGTEVLVTRRRMRVERAEPLDERLVRVRPRRPAGLVATGLVNLAIGVALMGAGLGTMFPVHEAPGSRNESGVAVATELGLGAPHMLVGSILLLVGAARWSPEVR